MLSYIPLIDDFSLCVFGKMLFLFVTLIAMHSLRSQTWVMVTKWEPISSSVGGSNSMSVLCSNQFSCAMLIYSSCHNVPGGC